MVTARPWEKHIASQRLIVPRPCAMLAEPYIVCVVLACCCRRSSSPVVLANHLIVLGQLIF
jgi:hypothetical protein